jgi:hypothetical protein
VDRRLARVEPHAHAHLFPVGPGRRGVRALGLDGSGHRVSGAREDEEEGVSLRVHLDAVRGAEGVSHDPTMPAQDVAVAVPEPLEELGRVLDVGEDERHGPAGKCGHAAIVRFRPVTVHRPLSEVLLRLDLR